MRRRFVQINGVLIDADQAPVEQPKSAGLQIIPDIAPYQAVAVDCATGDAPYITSRSKHREFLKRNGYIEYGNEKITPRQVPLDSPKSEITEAYRRAMRK
jgi:hypothetical protein